MVVGAAGRMGSAACAAVIEADGLDLVATVDRNGQADHQSIEAVDPTSVDVMVDLTVAEAARVDLAWAASHGVHAVVGTTGLSDDDINRLRAAFVDSNCLIAPNFAIGAVLMMRFAELAAPWFDTCEIIELHHDNKIDAPSGTARTTAERIAAASDSWAPDPTQDEVLAGSRGGLAAGAVRIHSVRMRGMLAHQEVILGAAGQTLTIRHDSYDRSSFMPGIVHACRVIADHPGLTVGLDSFLGL